MIARLSRVLVFSLILTGCATASRNTAHGYRHYDKGQNEALYRPSWLEPDSRFVCGWLVALPSLIVGVTVFPPALWAAGAGWAWGMSGAIEGCAQQGGC